MSIYTELVAIGATIDHHASDLYVKCTSEAYNIIKDHWRRLGITRFLDRNNEYWYDIPFEYDPFWESLKTSNPENK